MIAALGASADSDRGPRPHHARFGAVLREQGVVTDADISASLKAQRVSRARLGDILAARGLADRRRIAQAAARQRGMNFVDLDADPPDPGLARDADVEIYLRHNFLPWRRQGRRIVYATAEPERAHKALAALSDRRDSAFFVMVEPRAIRAALIAVCGPLLAARASIRRPDGYSMRAGAARWQRRAALAALLTFLAGAAALPQLAAAAALYLFAAIMAVNGVIWSAALVAGRGAGEPAPATSPEADARLADFRSPPRISLLIPLYREPETAPLLLCALRALDYPPELLDVKLILEADDEETRAALLALDPPAFVEVLVTPPGGPKTKPRALNFALDFAQGDIIGVYDAEDRPAPDQLRRIAAQFAASPPDVACIQARLGFYNTSENALTRCFEIEYAAWFDVMLPGLRRLDMPIPLGGTSLFIRRSALEALGGWDSHNVTEDADLGVMIARAGLRTALSASLTDEEANCRIGAWIRQRSRWLKGYLATWLTHMRAPRALWSDLGPARFVGFNCLMLGAVLGYLAMPFLWVAAALRYALDVEAAFGPMVADALSAAGQAAAVAAPAMAAAAALGLWRRGRRRMAGWLLAIPFYWPLGAAAAYLALYELVAQPFRWRKTSHGVGRIAARLRADALGRLAEEG